MGAKKKEKRRDNSIANKNRIRLHMTEGADNLVKNIFSHVLVDSMINLMV